jgi:hypothetical protein
MNQRTTLSKEEIFNAIGSALLAVLQSKISSLALPIRISELTTLRNLYVPPAADHQGVLVRGFSTLQGEAEILHQKKDPVVGTKNLT